MKNDKPRLSMMSSFQRYQFAWVGIAILMQLCSLLVFQKSHFFGQEILLEGSWTSDGNAPPFEYLLDPQQVHEIVQLNLDIEFSMQGYNLHENLFQTDAENAGLRMEVTPQQQINLLWHSPWALIAFPLKNEAVAGDQYKLRINYHPESMGLVFWEKKSLAPTWQMVQEISFGIHKPISIKNIQVGAGYSIERRFAGNVTHYRMEITTLHPGVKLGLTAINILLWGLSGLLLLGVVLANIQHVESASPEFRQPPK